MTNILLIAAGIVALLILLLVVKTILDGRGGGGGKRSHHYEYDEEEDDEEYDEEEEEDDEDDEEEEDEDEEPESGFSFVDDFEVVCEPTEAPSPEPAPEPVPAVEVVPSPESSPIPEPVPVVEVVPSPQPIPEPVPEPTPIPSPQVEVIEVEPREEEFNIPLVPMPRYNAPRSLVQIVNLNARHMIEIVGKQAVVYPHIVFDMTTGEKLAESGNGWKVAAGQKLAVTLGIKLLGDNIAANFIPAQTDYLQFEKSIVNLADFIMSKAIVTVQAEVLEDTYLLKDFGIGKIKLV